MEITNAGKLHFQGMTRNIAAMNAAEFSDNGIFEAVATLLKVQIDFGGGFNRNAAKLILAEVAREHGDDAAAQLIRTLELERIFGFNPDFPLALVARARRVLEMYEKNRKIRGAIATLW